MTRQRRRMVRGEPMAMGTTVERRERGRVVSRTEDVQEHIDEVPEAFARVGVKGSSTVNVGDYNSVQVAVWVELPCAPDGPSVQRTYKRGSKLVEQWIQEQLDAAVPNADS
jgi:hypothetical protein